MLHTEHYGLKKPEGNETAEIVDINENMDKVDTELFTHANNKTNPHGVTRGQIGAAETITRTATLSTSWSGSNPYTKTLSVTGILATDNPVVDAVLSADAVASKLILEAWGNVSRITTAANSITPSSGRLTLSKQNRSHTFVCLVEIE